MLSHMLFVGGGEESLEPTRQNFQKESFPMEMQGTCHRRDYNSCRRVPTQQASFMLINMKRKKIIRKWQIVTVPEIVAVGFPISQSAKFLFGKWKDWARRSLPIFNMCDYPQKVNKSEQETPPAGDPRDIY